MFWVTSDQCDDLVSAILHDLAIDIDLRALPPPAPVHMQALAWSPRCECTNFRLEHRRLVLTYYSQHEAAHNPRERWFVDSDLSQSRAKLPSHRSLKTRNQIVSNFAIPSRRPYAFSAIPTTSSSPPKPSPRPAQICHSTTLRIGLEEEDIYLYNSRNSDYRRSLLGHLAASL